MILATALAWVVTAVVDWVAISAVATAAAAMATSAAVWVALLQRGEAQRSAEAAIRAALAAERSAELQATAHAEQSRLATYPALGCEISREGPEVYVRVYNPSDRPAIDVDVAIVSLLWDHEEPHSEYVKRWVVEEYSDQALGVGVSDEGSFGVSDHVYYSAVPPRRAVKAVVAIPHPPGWLLAVLQFRDVLGRNYGQLIQVWWSESQERYTGTTTYPDDRVTEAPRVEFFGLGDDDAVPPPDYLKREFIMHFDYSFPSGWLRTGRGEIEDRGSWADV